MIDLSRRFFCFGAAATLIVPAPRKFFILEPPKLIIATPNRPFDLPDLQMTQLMMRLMGDRLTKDGLRMSQIPRWVVTDQAWYDQMVAKERAML